MTELFNRSDQKETRRALRSDMPPAERLLWSVLKSRTLDGLRFRRQHGIGPYIVDFYCPALHLAIELDGESHDLPGRADYDRIRDEFIRSHGVRVIRIVNDEVKSNLDGVWEGIRRMARDRAAELGVAVEPTDRRPRSRVSRRGVVDRPSREDSKDPKRTD